MCREINWTGDGEWVRGKAEKSGSYYNNQVRDHIKFKMTVTHLSGEIRWIFAKTNLEFSTHLDWREKFEQSAYI